MWPFEGRQQKLALLRSAFAAGDVDTVLVSASAGVGKTRLAREAIAGLGAQHTAWAAATRAAAAIPFAAVAPLLPDAAAHLLDDASAALVAHLARERLAFVVVNVRVGEPVADALLRLVRDGRGEQLRLDPLRYADMDRLIDHAAAGTAARARRRLRRIAAGNPLALRELLHGAEPGGLTELVVSRLDSLKPDVRFVVELTACAEPLPVPVRPGRRRAVRPPPRGAVGQSAVRRGAQFADDRGPGHAGRRRRRSACPGVPLVAAVLRRPLCRRRRGRRPCRERSGRRTEGAQLGRGGRLRRGRLPRPRAARGPHVRTTGARRPRSPSARPATGRLGISGRSQLRELLEDPASTGVGGPPNVTA